MTETEYQRPGWITTHVMNRLVASLTNLGLSIRGSRVLEVKGRKSGLPRRTPVNPLHLDDHYYLVSPRGETEWVRNLRADDYRLILMSGRRRRAWTAREVTGDDRLPVLGGYLRHWKAETGAFFHGVDPTGPEEAWRAEAARHPVFELQPAD